MSKESRVPVVGSLYLAASVTSRLRLGTAVTNLVTRHPAVVASTFATLHHVSGGRAHIGVGRGDTALELVGIRPPSAHKFEQQIGRLQTYLQGGVVDVEGFGSRITWLPMAGGDGADDGKVPVDVFGSGPHVITAGALLADRLTVTVGAEPERVEWAVQTARQARTAAGLDPTAIDVGPSSWWASERTRRRSTSWCAAMPASPRTSSGVRGRRCRRATPLSWPT